VTNDYPRCGTKRWLIDLSRGSALLNFVVLRIYYIQLGNRVKRTISSSARPGFPLKVDCKELVMLSIML